MNLEIRLLHPSGEKTWNTDGTKPNRDFPKVGLVSHLVGDYTDEVNFNNPVSVIHMICPLITHVKLQ
jgi:hypothetical protein